MHGPDLPGANSPAGIVRDAAGRVVRALTTGISDAVGKERRLISETRASAGMLLRAERDAAIPIDTSARALISNDQVYGGRREDAYTEWFRELHERGVDTGRGDVGPGKTVGLPAPRPEMGDRSSTELRGSHFLRQQRHRRRLGSREHGPRPRARRCTRYHASAGRPSRGVWFGSGSLRTQDRQPQAGSSQRVNWSRVTGL